MNKRCPACGSDRPDVCELLGHVYPIQPKAEPVKLASPSYHARRLERIPVRKEPT